mmetsp:Transcript_42903/g.110723  ORF Transcript_42903/g.110723 Transcript_42903/m.110723 type:complete len:238 (-) Transcript_42903:1511-2224(-)|eukprot:CAMPEP_0113901332 /NCGR_PEP_ID=MMETSP0780_2-20120614/21189_1 /TAXON_ID=652834 /ORGANISM="Palpitomonas bilix" /LENGTH=237 /DNA_ID=CAMNT_0000893921 /DNA_START=185 /DNA_END=898 /DNA_ORIENTATION=+ /assembly_acc=CAM_ASM_000599
MRKKKIRALEVESLRNVFSELDTNGDGTIDGAELREACGRRGYQPSKEEVADMIWEVDEDGDCCVNWEEFLSMYKRCTADQIGNEPRKLFNVVDFLIMDKDGNGDVNPSELYQTLYVRYGKEFNEDMLKSFFNFDDMLTQGITLKAYLQTLASMRESTLRKSALGAVRGKDDASAASTPQSSYRGGSFVGVRPSQSTQSSTTNVGELPRYLRPTASAEAKGKYTASLLQARKGALQR